MIVPLAVEREVGFAASREQFARILSRLESDESASWSHGELEEWLDDEGRELLRQLLQDHLDQRSLQEQRLEQVVDAEGVPRGSIESDHLRALETIFGDVEVSRLAYRRRGHPNLYPADAALNLPAERHSHGLRRLAAVEAAQGSFETTVEAIEGRTGQKLGKRQVEELVQRAAVDFEEYYRLRPRLVSDPTDLLVISCDGKGIVMRPEALRAATKEAARKASSKLKTRLSKGEKGNRKRMAEVGCVFEVHPSPRRPADVLAGTVSRGAARPAPKAKGKWATVSVVEGAATVIGRAFDEAERRDPDHRRTWIALVDGNNQQLLRIQAEAVRRQLALTIVIDFVHVLEYLWKAAWSFFEEGEPKAEPWVRERALAVLEGRASKVAGGIRRSATRRGLSPQQRKGADVAARYLTRKAAYLDYPTALANGWPIATGVIEGTCRHLVKDRMDLTGARWGVAGAEAVLKLRTLRTNRDFSAYWRFHLSRERRRVHESRYRDEVIPSTE